MKHPVMPMGAAAADYVVLKRGDNLLWDNDVGDFQPYDPATFASNFTAIADDGGDGSGTTLKCFTRHALLDPGVSVFVFVMQQIGLNCDPLNDVCLGAYYLPGNGSQAGTY